MRLNFLNLYVGFICGSMRVKEQISYTHTVKRDWITSSNINNYSTLNSDHSRGSDRGKIWASSVEFLVFGSPAGYMLAPMFGSLELQSVIPQTQPVHL